MIASHLSEAEKQRRIERSRYKQFHLGLDSLQALLGDRFPQEYEIVSISSETFSNGLCFLIRHPDFDPVPESMEAPTAYAIAQVDEHGTMTIERFE